MKVKHKLILIVAPPLLCLAAMAANNIGSSMSDRQQARQVLTGVEQATVISDLIHALQRERGASAGFIGSGGRAFGDKLSSHKKGVDQAIVRYSEIRNAFQGAPDQSTALVASRLNQLYGMRSQVTGLNANVSEAAQFYSSAIDGLIEIADAITAAHNSSLIADHSQAYLALMRAKESAGIERAMGANGFGAGVFAPNVYKRFTDLAAEQQVLLVEARRFAAPNDAQAIFDFEGGAVSEEVTSFRDRAQASVFGQPLESNFGPAWFTASTARIDAMKVLEDRLAESLKAVAQAEAAASQSRSTSALTVSLLVFAGSLVFAFYSARGIGVPLGNLSKAMKVIENGDFKTKVGGAKRRDEIGDMARTLTQFRDKLETAESTNALMVAKSAAFEGSSSAMMMIDRDFVVTFINGATQKLLSDKAEAFKQIWPGFNHEKIIGTCIDIFHKDPAHQRQLLSDPTRLPYRTDINVGDMKISLFVSGIFDNENNYVGNVLEWDDVTEQRLNKGIIEIIQDHQATIEFTMDGHIIKANENFLKVMGYGLEEIQGKHHAIFVDEDFKRSTKYREFWEELKSGKILKGKFRRVDSGGREVWIDATYNPILDLNGKPFKIVKIATDITEQEKHAEERAAMEKEQSRVVETLSVGLKNLSDGDLTSRFDEPFAAEYEQLRESYNAAIDKLQHALRGVVDNAGGIRTGASEVSQAADDLSRRTENQAASLEQTAAALDELTASVKSAAEGANKANEVVSDARQNAESSGAVVQNAVTAMSEIEKSSTQISQIIGVIDDIAFQTNLLALNAGVEAARAGDAGRGFAVVASEVRALAQRSSEAAREIKQLISASSQHVEKGVDLVGQAGSALKEIVSSVGEINSLVSEIAASAKEQSTGITEINSAVNQMDQGTQQNAAMVEETTAASHSLNQDAEELVRLVSLFKTGDEGDSAEKAPVVEEANNAPAPQQDIAEQQARAAAFMNGSAAVDMHADQKEDDWQDF